MKIKSKYVCSQCAAFFSQWAGQCSQCGAWNSLTEEQAPSGKSQRLGNYANQRSEVTLVEHVALDDQSRMDCGLSELNRVLGGGLVDGSVVLIGGDPGIGKSTLLLHTLANLSQQQNVLYVTGEESLQQVAMRAKRLQLPVAGLRLLAETQVESILAHAQKEKPRVMVIDSIQTIFTDTISSAPGGVSQVRESAAQLVRFAKMTQTAVFLVGHVTKEGALAGPRVLEHMVDCVLYFEGQNDSRFRVIRAIKNRFGAVNELGIFAMTDRGLKEVANPSAIFLSRQPDPTPGSAVMVTWEGSRPMLVEVQALVDQAHGQQAKRVTAGLEQNRLAILLAVLHRHGGIPTYDQDVFINVVGGVKVTETASDLALLAAVVSSLRNRIFDSKTIIFGEVGLAGEIRPVQSGQERLKEAAKHGFKRAIVPHANAPKQAMAIEVEPVKHLQEVLQKL
ncbi:MULTISPECIES: DNA repair protein RadA [Legionella]|uniref:DNA repair protein RadA n=1 Tax=Legionella septentrionalis TaxID=2498109 RepID=A0A3S0V6M2_9GAMM|nr:MULTISPECIES: DNA repair protein RadA [Legionella]MCP0913075.1 DNA repair protein RadA [Legionella sp. 27cVA30]RUQ91525.1 DNA repair protein RadA [Legionella septentrionalis]RUQ95001.1 DNA repair protein RadA [Legionella septentrionalis]RUR10577.1 DNA repair protein RadA [Legionella septentrionalis]RUR13793.1 DNA repair protein RadA [Legionella septentrionalis]